jgi:hypothetical protein
MARANTIMAEKPQRLRTFIDKAVPDSLVIGFEQLAKSRDLSDPGDSHVVAVAIKAGAQGSYENPSLFCG